ncbi:oxidoreductase [Polyangium jinanense]|uniref:Oxidoreductase n=1 Tax=Polyangium jinanense TaxID=2829994 RepID=A0A9X4AZS7_9BACT|nr:oxidoreductase [Polyangium jinanense]MDC3962498.1 oxidoreductase [Polyangium jinanense]MDC3988447.1 oxidoreductase [Polyangium jinanense]
MSLEGRTALLAGATGLVGRDCLARLLEHPAYARVVVLVRRSTGMNHDKLQELRADFDALDDLPALPAVDDVFIALGTTIKAAGSRPAFYKVDHDYVVSVAKLGKRAGARRLSLVSSIGADRTSMNFYLRVKGEAERDISELGYECVDILRPSMLLGDRTEHRTGEALAAPILRIVSGAMIGPLRVYRAIEARDVAAAMVGGLVSDDTAGVRIRTFDDIRNFAS